MAVQGSTSRIPGDFQQLGQRKGFLRYMSEDLRELVTRRTDAIAERDIALAGILKVGTLHNCVSALCRHSAEQWSCRAQSLSLI